MRARGETPQASLPTDLPARAADRKPLLPRVPRERDLPGLKSRVRRGDGGRRELGGSSDGVGEGAAQGKGRGVGLGLGLWVSAL